MTKPECGNCFYHLASPEMPEDEVFCRRYPPYIVPVTEGGESTLASRFPAMKTFGWCGEHAEASRSPAPRAQVTTARPPRPPRPPRPTKFHTG